jgi:subtilisin-like proprotein convertase family protein
MKKRFASLLSLALLGSLAATAAEEHTIRTGTDQPTDYVVAEDELHNLTRDRAESVAGGGITPRLRAQAVGDAEVRDLVLYPKGAPRTEWNRRVLTREVLVRLTAGTDAAAVARAVGAVAGPEIAYAPRHYIFRVTQPGAALAVAAQLAGRPGVEHVEPMLKRKMAKRFVPNDPLFSNQWTLLNTGQNGATVGVDINVTNVWDTYRGTGIVIGVIDDGFQYTHPDLAANARTDIQFDYRDNDNDPKPEGVGAAADSHGTAVGGVIGAVGNNGIGVTGVAFDSRLVGIRLIGGNTGDTQDAGALSHRNDIIHIYNNSWGPSDDGTVKGGAGTLALAALRTGVTSGRGGKGNIFVWAAGNGGLDLDNAGYDSYNGSIYTISVGALNDLGKKADYSERGACLIVSAPSGAESGPNGRPQGTTTTDNVGDFGSNRSGVAVGPVGPDELADRDYTQNFNGTSSAAPVVSGVVALMLQANPNLGWRDVQEVLIRTASKTDPTNNEWRTNKAGLKFNPNFGAGLVNAGAAVALATNWINLPPMISTASEQAGLNEAIPDNNNTGITRSFDLSASNLRVEQTLVTVDITHQKRGDLVINLISPSGTVSPLAELHNDTNPDYTAMSFRSTFNWGEDSKGTWQVQISDQRAADVGTLTRVKLEVFGTTPSVPTLVAKTVANGRFKLGVAGIPALYTLQVNTNATVTNWTTLFSTNAPASVFDLIDSSASGPQRFYRLVR